MADQRLDEDAQRAAPQAQRRQRLAEALRENLKRRKQQARARRAAADAPNLAREPPEH